jgi:hypothetical protein
MLQLARDTYAQKLRFFHISYFHAVFPRGLSRLNNQLVIIELCYYRI